MADSQSRLIAVVGGGITGLAAARRLAEQGCRLRLFEESGRTGGVVGTEITGGWLVESGPNSLREGSEGISDEVRELGLAGERIVAAPATKNRYLVRGGRLVPVPLSPAALLKTPLFSIGTKVRILAEILAPRRERAEEASIAEFFRDHFGSDVVDAAVQPIVSGLCAGDAARLSAREIFPQLCEAERTRGSILRGRIATGAVGKAGSGRIISFRRGMQALPEALAGRLPEGAVALNSRIDRLIPGERWTISGLNQTGGFTEECDAVIATLPAGPLSRLAIGGAEDRPLAALAGIRHPPLSSLFLGFRREEVAHPLDGFGVLVPATEKRSVIGILFSSSLFPGRAPEGHVALTVLIGGMLQPEMARPSTGDLVAAVRGDLRDLLGVTGEPVFVRHAFWPQAIPQYELGHGRHRRSVADCAASHPGLYVGGQVCDGISVAACLSAGKALADRALAQETRSG